MKTRASLVIAVGLSFSHLSFGEVSPWLPSPGSFSVTFSQTEQTADEFYFGDEKRALASDLELSTSAVNITYGLSDYLSLDAKVGYAESDFNSGSNQSSSGIIDSSIGLTWQLVNEHASENGWPSIAARLGVIIDGDYETGAIDSIGDGGNGVELSIASGKAFNSYISFSSDIGIRDRSNNIPTELFYGASLYISPITPLTTYIGYRVIDSRGDLQIGGSGFTADRFPEVEEDSEYIQLGAQLSVIENVSLGLTLAQVIDGKNTSINDVYAFNVGYTF